MRLFRPGDCLPFGVQCMLMKLGRKTQSREQACLQQLLTASDGIALGLCCPTLLKKTSQNKKDTTPRTPCNWDGYTQAGPHHILFSFTSRSGPAALSRAAFFREAVHCCAELYTRRLALAVGVLDTPKFSHLLNLSWWRLDTPL